MVRRENVTFMMDPSNHFDFSRIHALALRMLEDTLSPTERQELESLLLENSAARRGYLEHVQESACLRWLCMEEFGDGAAPVVMPVAASDASGSRFRKWAIFSGGLLAGLLAVVIGMQLIGRSGADKKRNAEDSNMVHTMPQAPAESVGSTSPDIAVPVVGLDRPMVATITSLNAARWSPPTFGVKILSQWAVGDRLHLRGGSAELTFDTGAQLTVFGPADIEITSATSIRCLRGRVTTLVDKRGRGFSIETPGAKVVDLGTQFGLSISDEGETEVVVFQGAVDLSNSRQAASGEAASRRMQQGEALLVRNSGEFERVVAVQRNSFLKGTERGGRHKAEPVIADVRDNIRNAQSPVKSYQIVRGGLEDDALAFVDRGHEWNGLDGTGLPAFLFGADYIMPFNDDKFVRGLELKVTLLRPSTLYVFIDNNMTVPDWMRDGFTDTGVDIGLDCSKTTWHKDHSLGVGSGKSIDFKFSVWKRDIEKPGTITLGGVEPPEDHALGFNMYGIAAVAKE